MMCIKKVAIDRLTNKSSNTNPAIKVLPQLPQAEIKAANFKRDGE